VADLKASGITITPNEIASRDYYPRFMQKSSIAQQPVGAYTVTDQCAVEDRPERAEPLSDREEHRDRPGPHLDREDLVYRQVGARQHPAPTDALEQVPRVSGPIRLPAAKAMKNSGTWPVQTP